MYAMDEYKWTIFCVVSYRLVCRERERQRYEQIPTMELVHRSTKKGHISSAQVIKRELLFKSKAKHAFIYNN